MLFAIICYDKPDRFALRQELRPAHLEYLGGYRDNLVLAGPMLAADGESSVGGLLIVDFPNLADAERFAAEDPYVLGGLFEAQHVRRWRQVIPAPGDG